ncbi:MAG: hypothetical protein L0210_08850 [Rhodospirillales bacterium]|nr:hypothetical protein [Rhodospirillales bacterium]
MGHHSRAVWLYVLSALALSGCFSGAQDSAVPSAIGESGFDLVSYTGTTRGTYIWPEGNSKRICAEPPPDLGLTTAREISANLKAAATSLGAIASPSIDAGGAAKLSSAAIELAGRSQLVLLTREFLYRQCELAANFKPGTPEYNALSEQYRQVLEVVLRLADADKTRAAAELQAILNEAAALNKMQDAKIATILGVVTKADGTIDKDALKKLLDLAKIGPSVRKAIEGRTTIADLLEFLRDLPDADIEALVAALPKKG